MPDYLVKQEDVAIAGAANLTIRELFDRQQFADPSGASAALGISSAAWPLFGQLWPSGRVLADLMAARLVTRERILELGCGLALASLVSHRRGADITASDWHPLAAEFLAENLRLNGMEGLRFVKAPWGDDGVALGRFDLIIGSDILYERDDEGVLAGFIQLHAQVKAEVLIVDPDRGNRPPFNRRMLALGFLLTDTRADCVQADGTRYKGRLLRFTRV